MRERKEGGEKANKEEEEEGVRGRERRELCVIVSTRKGQSENRQAGRSSNDAGPAHQRAVGGDHRRSCAPAATPASALWMVEEGW